MGGKLRRRESLEDPTPLEPNQSYKLRIPIFPIRNFFLSGQRIRLTVPSSRFPKRFPNHNKFLPDNELASYATAQYKLCHDAQRASALILSALAPWQLIDID